jgi:hypothetical protein
MDPLVRRLISLQQHRQPARGETGDENQLTWGTSAGNRGSQTIVERQVSVIRKLLPEVVLHHLKYLSSVISENSCFEHSCPSRS